MGPRVPLRWPGDGAAAAAQLRGGSSRQLLGIQRLAIAVGSAVGALADPARADLVAALGETTGERAFARMRDRMATSQEGRELLQERPRVTNQSVAHAWDMPTCTFGAAYASFMGSRNFQADERPPVRFVDDSELAYVAARAREVHDFWHVLFGLPTTVPGELALKMVEAVQTGMPMAALSVLGGPLRLTTAQRVSLVGTYYPWAVKAGLRANDLLSIYYERHLHELLDEVRDRWRIDVAPAMPQLARSQASYKSSLAAI
eukprot:SM000328S12458  [mRNA]  locus=s328:97872:99740:+ [translate_table: standard]